jgi:hypothetical protein
MHSLRSTGRNLRLALAGLFAVMSLFHGPVMTFAHAMPAAMQHSGTGAHDAGTGAHAAAHHSHLAVPAPEDDAAQDIAPRAATCYAFGCFIALATSAIGAPQSGPVLLGRLGPAIGRDMIPARSDPADPPPRLRA